MAGTMFREINYLRNAVAVSERQRLEYKTQNAMLRGEIELTKCQSALAKEILQKKNRRTSLGGTIIPAIKNKTNFKENSLKRDVSATICINSKQNNRLQQNASLSNSVPDISNFWYYIFALFIVCKILLNIFCSEMINAILEDQKPKKMLITNNKDQYNALQNKNLLNGTEEQQNMYHKRCQSVTELTTNLIENGSDLRQELEIMREAFQTQVLRLRNTNKGLERRVDDLEKRVNKV